MINSKLFEQALAGDTKAIAILNKKFAEMEEKPKGTYIDQQLAIIRKALP
jgi:hypothetical protein